MASQQGSSTHLVIMLMTVTLLTSVHQLATANTTVSRRLLAYSAQRVSGKSQLYTIELSNTTSIADIYQLKAGTTIRLAGTLNGHTISAKRIDVLRT